MDVETNFTAAIATDAKITRCLYYVSVPCIPTTFNSDANRDHWEIKKCNELHQESWSKLDGSSQYTEEN